MILSYSTDTLIAVAKMYQPHDYDVTMKQSACHLCLPSKLLLVTGGQLVAASQLDWKSARILILAFFFCRIEQVHSYQQKRLACLAGVVMHNIWFEIILFHLRHVLRRGLVIQGGTL